jgi:hypothetical protein
MEETDRDVSQSEEKGGAGSVQPIRLAYIVDEYLPAKLEEMDKC